MTITYEKFKRLMTEQFPAPRMAKIDNAGNVTEYQRDVRSGKWNILRASSTASRRGMTIRETGIGGTAE